jgi:hypothetical protein
MDLVAGRRFLNCESYMQRKLLWESKWKVDVTADGPFSHRLLLLQDERNDGGAKPGRSSGRAVTLALVADRQFTGT